MICLGNITITATKPRAILAFIIIDNLLKMTCEENISLLRNSSLLNDANKSGKY